MHTSERKKLEDAIAALKAQREVLGDAVVDAALGSLQETLSGLVEAEKTAQQRKLVTVLFMDIVGSTSITQNLDPEDTMAMFDSALQRLAHPVDIHGGRVTRYMGDGFLALFGASVARENEPEMAIRAGLQILAETKVYAQELEAEWGIPDFNVRVGISTGLVIIGGETEAKNTVMGKTVNLASRLENAARPGTLLISHHTYQHVRGLFDVQSLDPIKLKGFPTPIAVYQVHRAKPSGFPLSPRWVAGIETRMIGRDPELLMLQNLFHDATDDVEVRVVTVLGDAGVGKSRLLYEFEKWLELLPEKVQTLRGSGTPETDRTPNGLLRRIFAKQFGILESDRAAEVHQKFRAGMAPVLNPNQADLVGQLLGFDFSASQAVQAQFGGESSGDLAVGYLTSYLRFIANDPTIIMLEDIHWADDSSLDLLDHVMTEVHNTRLLVVCLARPWLFENRPNWGEGQEIHTRIHLKPLSRRASRALVAEILQKAEAIPKKLRDLIVEGAEGNPFYVEELIKMLIEDGVIVAGEHHWRIEMGRLAEIHVPPTLIGVLQARLDSLPTEEKILLQRAAVVGRQFWGSTVAALVGDQVAAAEVNKLLGVLRERELIFQREVSGFEETNEYSFKHALLRDVIYETVLLKDRRVYHQQVAGWLETAAGERIEEYLGLIAGHYELAGDGKKAVACLLRAGDRARLAYTHQEAVEYYRRALALLKKQDEHTTAARTMMKLGMVYHTAFDYQRSRQAFEAGFALWQQAEATQAAVVSPPAPHAFRMARANPSTLDPTMADDSFSGGIINQLFSGLVEGRLAMETMPDVARSWELSADGKRYVFHLRDDVYWSDGVPVTAGDFEYAWKRILDSGTGSPNASLLYDIKGARRFHQGEISDWGSVGVQALDDLTLVVELEGPAGYFLSLLAHYATFPVPQHVLQIHGEAWTEKDRIVTNGAFVLKSWEPGKKMSLLRSPRYHGRFVGNLQQVEIAFDVVWQLQLEMYEAGKLDFVSFGGTPPERDRARQKHAGNYVSTPMLGATYLSFDVSRPPFDNPLVRRAFAMATDKVILADAVLRGYEFPGTGGFVPPGMAGHSTGICPVYDPEKARKLLAEAGYPGGAGFPAVDAWTWQGIKSRADCLHEQWRDNLGVTIDWQIMDFSQFIDRVDKDPVHISQTVWMPDYPDPDSVLRASPIRRRTHWRNATYDALVEEARRVLDQEKRLELYARADRILVEEDVVVIPLTYMWSHMLVKPWVRKFPASAINEWLWKDFVIEAHSEKPHPAE